MNALELPIGAIKHKGSRIVYVIVFLVFVITAIATKNILWLIPLVSIWGLLVIVESACDIKKTQKKNLALYIKLSELRNMVIDQANAKEAKHLISEYINSLSAMAISLYREIRTVFEEQRQREYVDMFFDFKARETEFALQETMWESFYIDLANYLDVQRERIELSDAKKQRVRSFDKEMPDA